MQFVRPEMAVPFAHRQTFVPEKIVDILKPTRSPTGCLSWRTERPGQCRRQTLVDQFQGSQGCRVQRNVQPLPVFARGDIQHAPFPVYHLPGQTVLTAFAQPGAKP